MIISPDKYLLFISIVTLIVITPGPNLFLLISMGPEPSRLSSLLTVLGMCFAIICHATLALIGVGAIIATSAVLFTALKAMGAAYLIWIGIKTLLSVRNSGGLLAEPATNATLPSGPQAFARGYVSNILNPKPAIFYVAVFPQFLSPQQPGFYSSGALLGLTHAAIALIFYGLVVFLIERLSKKLMRPLVSRIVRILSGTALLFLGGRLLMTRAPS